VPETWFVVGMAAATIGVVVIQVISFSIHWWMGVTSVFLFRISSDTRWMTFKADRLHSADKPCPRPKFFPSMP
jgi:hypothetical protein